MLSYVSFISLLGFFSFSEPEEITPKILFSGFIYETAPFPSCHASTLVETSDGKGEWNTVGVHENVIAASAMALEDAVTFGLLRQGRKPE